jgi:hypothetical protein
VLARSLACMHSVLLFSGSERITASFASPRRCLQFHLIEPEGRSHFPGLRIFFGSRFERAGRVVCHFLVPLVARISSAVV